VNTINNHGLAAGCHQADATGLSYPTIWDLQTWAAGGYNGEPPRIVINTLGEGCFYDINNHGNAVGDIEAALSFSPYQGRAPIVYIASQNAAYRLDERLHPSVSWQHRWSRFESHAAQMRSMGINDRDQIMIANGDLMLAYLLTPIP
jgi:hypothetical protein